MRAASIEIFAVSPSRISPTITTSGSERRIERSAAANVMPARALICTWLIPFSRYSTGSSTVMMLISGLLIWFSAANSVVDLPEPVGPVTRSAPVGRETMSDRVARISSERPSSSRVGGVFDLSRRRMTTDSPSTVGRVATRTSSERPTAAAFSEMRPSCGFRRSAMSSFASTLRRVTTPAVIRFGISCISCSTPSIRNRTTSESACGAKWTSEAPSSAAWKSTELTRRTSGASEIPSSASRSVESSSSALRRELGVEVGKGCECRATRTGANELADLDADLVARRDAELERVPGREPQGIDAVEIEGVRESDLDRVAHELVRDRAVAVEDMQREERRGVLVDARQSEIDEREPRPPREDPRAAVAGDDADLDQLGHRLDDRIGDRLAWPWTRPAP